MKEHSYTEQSYYVHLKRRWRNGDTVEIALPKNLQLEPLPDNPRRVAILWGPLVLAGDLGPESKAAASHPWKPKQRVPVFVAGEKFVDRWLKPVPDKPGHFRTDGVGRDRDVEFVPFYRLHRRTYGIYWDLFTPEEWEVRKAEYAAEDERRRKLEAATVAFVQPGQMQPERDFNFQTGDKNPRPVRTDGRPGRRASTWFSFDLPVEADTSMTLVLTYCSAEWRRGDARFAIEINGKHLADEVVTRKEPTRFYEKEYPVAASLIQGMKKVTVTFRANKGSSVAGVYGLRMIRGDVKR
jgi:hypothetical protein